LNYAIDANLEANLNSEEEKVNEFKDLLKIINTSSIKSKQNDQLDNNKNINDNQFTFRSNVSSAKKLSGETPIKDLEPTLKMVIIRELSAEKSDGLSFFLAIFE
jgi:hypothetical protein